MAVNNLTFEKQQQGRFTPTPKKPPHHQLGRTFQFRCMTENLQQLTKNQLRDTINVLEDTYAEFLGQGMEASMLNTIFKKIKALKHELSLRPGDPVQPPATLNQSAAQAHT